MAELFEVASVLEAGAVGLDEDEAHAARSAVGLVLTTTMTRSHIWPFEMNVFWPEMTYSSPWRSARVRMPCRSLPVPGSVMAIAQPISPEPMRGSHFFFCSSLA